MWEWKRTLKIATRFSYGLKRVAPVSRKNYWENHPNHPINMRYCKKNLDRGGWKMSHKYIYVRFDLVKFNKISAQFSHKCVYVRGWGSPRLRFSFSNFVDCPSWRGTFLRCWAHNFVNNFRVQSRKKAQWIYPWKGNQHRYGVATCSQLGNTGASIYYISYKTESRKRERRLKMMKLFKRRIGVLTRSHDAGFSAEISYVLENCHRGLEALSFQFLYDCVCQTECDVHGSIQLAQKFWSGCPVPAACIPYYLAALPFPALFFCPFLPSFQLHPLFFPLCLLYFYLPLSPFSLLRACDKYNFDYVWGSLCPGKNQRWVFKHLKVSAGWRRHAGKFYRCTIHYRLGPEYTLSIFASLCARIWSRILVYPLLRTTCASALCHFSHWCWPPPWQWMEDSALQNIISSLASVHLSMPIFHHRKGMTRYCRGTWIYKIVGWLWASLRQFSTASPFPFRLDILPGLRASWLQSGSS